MADKKSTPIGFRPEFVPMNFEISPHLQVQNQTPQKPTSSPKHSESSSSSSSSSSTVSESEKFPENYIIFDYGCSWQHVNVSGPFPDNMVRGGVDADGAIIYIGRAFHEGDMIPAKVIPDKNTACVCYGGEEHYKEDVEVLRAGSFVWEFASSGNIPEGAVSCGQTADGELLYVGRCLHQGTQTPGKVQISHGCLYIPFDGAEVAVSEYEVLCLK